MHRGVQPKALTGLPELRAKLVPPPPGAKRPVESELRAFIIVLHNLSSARPLIRKPFNNEFAAVKGPLSRNHRNRSLESHVGILRPIVNPLKFATFPVPAGDKVTKTRLLNCRFTTRYLTTAIPLIPGPLLMER